MINRITRKAEACAKAYALRYGVIPTRHAVVTICSVALHETALGDAWKASGNWGAIQRRAMTPAERELARTGQPIPARDPFEGLHGDSSPIHGQYQAWYWHFPVGITYPPAGLAGDEAGAWKLCEVLLDNRPAIKAVIDTIDEETLAKLMYESRYYEGVHDPRVQGGKEANVRDYASALEHCRVAIERDLGKDWQPLPSIPSVNLQTVTGWQQALNLLGAQPRLKVDGVYGTQTRAEMFQFQAKSGLKVDGIVGPNTRDALQEALDKLVAS